MTAVGIDFGTTNSVVAVRTSAGVDVLPIDKAPAKWAPYGFDNVFPSVMARDEDSRLCFGWDAKQRSSGRFDAVKRMFATQLDVATDDAGSALAVDEVATMLFAELKRRALGCGFDATQAVVTVPANSKGLARLRTKSCAAMAGFEVLALINEPTAAAMAYARKHPESRQLLVFDWGGGTLDVTILQSVDGTFIEQASSGLQRSGGIDFDSRLEKMVRETTPGLESLSVDARHLLRTEVELAKIRLSSADATSVELPNGGEFRITRTRFEQEVTGLLEEARIPLQRCLSDLQIGPGSIDSVVLVGGTCKIPAVRRFVESALRAEIDPDINPMTAVGEGAAIAASILTGEFTDADFFVCLEHALGTWVLDPTTGGLRFSTIIRKGNKLPAKATEPFLPVSAESDSVNVAVVEGDPDSTRPDYTVLKDWKVNLPSTYSEGSNRAFELTYEYDVNGILRVRATDSESGSVLLDDDISFGISSDKKRLKLIADRSKTAVAEGKMSKDAEIVLQDSEAAKLIEQARVKVIPFLDHAEAVPVIAAVEAVESNDAATFEAAKSQLRKVMQPYSYLF